MWEDLTLKFSVKITNISTPNHVFTYYYKIYVCTAETSCRLYCFRWVTAEWEPCSKTCGDSGVQNRAVYCASSLYGDDVPVDTYYCDINLVPKYNRPCKRVPCPAAWKVGDWGEVSTPYLMFHCICAHC